jgi:hypothetical protein
MPRGLRACKNGEVTTDNSQSREDLYDWPAILNDMVALYHQRFPVVKPKDIDVAKHLGVHHTWVGRMLEKSGGRPKVDTVIRWVEYVSDEPGEDFLRRHRLDKKPLQGSDTSVKTEPSSTHLTNGGTHVDSGSRAHIPPADLARDLRATADALKRIGLDAQFASTTLRHVAEAVDAAADRPVPGTGTDEPDSSQDAR